MVAFPRTRLFRLPPSSVSSCNFSTKHRPNLCTSLISLNDNTRLQARNRVLCCKRRRLITDVRYNFCMPTKTNNERAVQILFIGAFAVFGTLVPALFRETCYKINDLQTGVVSCDAWYRSIDFISNVINPHPAAFEPVGLAIIAEKILAAISAIVFGLLGAFIWRLWKR